MEVENIMYNTYAGDLVQYVSVWYPEHGTCGAGVNQEGEKQVTGRWAESWEESEDGTVWTFKLRKGIVSYAGNEMTCEDHRWSWERGFEMKAVKFFFTKVLLIEKHEDVSCPDPYNRPVQDQGEEPALPAASRHELLRRRVRLDRGAEARDGGRPVGEGVAEEQHGGLRALPPREPYPGSGAHPGAEPELPAAAPRSGRSSPRSCPIRRPASPSSSVARSTTRCAFASASTGRWRTTRTSRSRTTRGTSSPTSGRYRPTRSWPSRKSRRALAYAIPYEDIHQKVYFGGGHLIKTITPQIYPNATDKFWVYKEDLDTAKKLLAEAGYPDGFDMTISYDKAISEMEEACTLIKSNFEKIGIRVQLQGLPSAVYSDTKFSRKQMAHCDNFQWPWIADTGYTAWVYLTHPDVNVMDAGAERRSGAERADGEDVRHRVRAGAPGDGHAHPGAGGRDRAVDLPRQHPAGARR